MSWRKRPPEDVSSHSHGQPSGNCQPSLDTELPADLRAFEAQLASMTPRADLPDRDALLFRAGQLSVLDKAGAQFACADSWRWRAGFAAMSAVAAALLIALLVRPKPPVVERIRVVTVRTPNNDGDQISVERPTPAEAVERPKPPLVRHDSVPPPPRPGNTFAALLQQWFWMDEQKLQQETAHWSLRNAILTEGLDAWKNEPAEMVPEEQESAQPTNRRQWIESLLADRV